jgi:signal transduction histidine kinase
MILLAISLLKLSFNIINQPDKGFYRTIALYKFVLASPYIVVVLMLFFWSPAKLYDLTASGQFFFLNNQMQDRVVSSNIALRVLPAIALMTLFFSLNLTRIIRKIDFKQLSISQSIHTASMSIKVFNHSIKNHLLAIQYEIDHLKTSNSFDSDSEKSLILIEKSINHSLSTLNITKDILNEYHPIKEFYSAESPLLSAVQRLSSSSLYDRIHIKLPKDIPMCKMDFDAISETIYNLITNAIDAIGNKRDGEITISLRSHNDLIIITISDNGCGIQPEEIDSIFIPFKSTKSSTKNWGLGLSYCYKVIEAHNGTISVTSRPNEMTQFLIRLPLS